jgi:hypothetical protein
MTYPPAVGRKPVTGEKPLVPYATRLPEDQVKFLRSLAGDASSWLREVIGQAMIKRPPARKR